MKIDREAFVKALRLVVSVIDTNSAVTILQYACVAGGTIQGSSGVIGVMCQAPSLEYPFCVAADWLLSLLSKFDHEDVDLSIDKDILKVKAGRHISRSPTADYKKFPNLMSAVADSTLCSGSQAGFAKAIKTLLQLTPNSSQTNLQGVALLKDAVYATDGTRATRCRWDGNVESQIVLPREAAALLAKQGDPVTMRVGAKGTSMLFTYPGYVIISRTLATQVPCKMIDEMLSIPPLPNSLVLFDPKTVIPAIDRVKIMGGEEGLSVDCKDGTLKLSRGKAGLCLSEEEVTLVPDIADFSFSVKPEQFGAAIDVVPNCDLTDVLGNAKRSLRFFTQGGGPNEVQHLVSLIV